MLIFRRYCTVGVPLFSLLLHRSFEIHDYDTYSCPISQNIELPHITTALDQDKEPNAKGNTSIIYYLPSPVH